MGNTLAMAYCIYSTLFNKRKCMSIVGIKYYPALLLIFNFLPPNLK